MLIASGVRVTALLIPARSVSSTSRIVLRDRAEALTRIGSVRSVHERRRWRASPADGAPSNGPRDAHCIDTGQRRLTHDSCAAYCGQTRKKALRGSGPPIVLHRRGIRRRQI